MIEFRGFFKDINDNDVVVEITKQSDENLSFTIGEDGIYFAGNSPVTITQAQNIENEFQIILSKQCTINLITEDYMGDYLFADNARDVEVTVLRYINQGNQTKRFVLFNGFLEPISFSQPYSRVLNSFTLTANDYLGTLQYLTYKNITLTDFDDSKQEAANRSFKDILYEIIPSARIWYDQSKGIDENSIQNIFDDLGVFDIYMIGETADDLWTQEEVIQEMLRYLNLHIVMNGSDFYLFDWDSMMAGETINWLNLGTKRVKRGTFQEVTLTKEYYDGDDTNVTVSDVFNQIQVTDELESLEDLIKSPLDSDSLQPLYPRKSWYMTEYSSLGSGSDAMVAWYDMIDGRATNFEGAKEHTWFIQPMYNPEWKLNLGDGRTIEDLVEHDEYNLPINAYKLPLYANTHRFTPLILNCGSTTQRPETNNSPIAKVDLEPYLFISIKGNNADPSTNSQAMKPSPGDEQDYQDFQDHAPILEYISKISGGTYSPVDEGTINYIVFSGKLLLQPVVYECDRYLGAMMHGRESVVEEYAEASYPFTKVAGPTWDEQYQSYKVSYSPVSSINKDDGRYYTRKFYEDVSTGFLGRDECLVNYIDPETGRNQVWDYRLMQDNLNMWTEDPGQKLLEYKYSVVGNSNQSKDLIKKLPILECSLVIGDKCLVEYDMDEYGGSKFKWVDKNEGYPETFLDDNGNEVTKNKFTFSLGIDPNTESADTNPDFIIGQEYELQNTVDMFTMDLNGPEGTAIPIKRSDALAGKVEFKILGPINLTYDEITRKNGNFWYWHTRWYETSKAVLSHLESIIIKDFEAKLYTSGASDAPDADLIYVSDETDRYVSKNDDTTFKFITQLSSQECLQKGIKPSINQNAVINIKTNIPVSSIYNRLTDETAKAEEHYVDQYYRIFSKPKVMMQTTIHDGLGVDFESICDTDYMEKPSYVLGIDQDLKMSTMTIKIKEI